MSSVEKEIPRVITEINYFTTFKCGNITIVSCPHLPLDLAPIYLEA